MVRQNRCLWLVSMCFTAITVANFDRNYIAEIRANLPSRRVVQALASPQPTQAVDDIWDHISRHDRAYVMIHATEENSNLLTHLLRTRRVHPDSQLHGEYIITYAHRNHNYLSVITLLEHGADISPITHSLHRHPQKLMDQLCASIQYGYVHALQKLLTCNISEAKRKALLIFASTRNTVKATAMLLDALSEPLEVYIGRFPLYVFTARCERHEICREFLRKAIERHALGDWLRLMDNFNGDLTIRTQNGSTLLHTAITHRAYCFINRLRSLCTPNDMSLIFPEVDQRWANMGTYISYVDRAHDPNGDAYGTTPLTWAVQLADPAPIISRLLNSPHDANIVNTIDGAGIDVITQCCQSNARQALLSILHNTRYYPDIEQAYGFLFDTEHIDEDTLTLAEILWTCFPQKEHIQTLDELYDALPHNNEDISEVRNVLALTCNILHGHPITREAAERVCHSIHPTTLYILSLRAIAIHIGKENEIESEMCSVHNIYNCTHNTCYNNAKTLFTLHKNAQSSYISGMVRSLAQNTTTQHAVHHDMRIIQSLL